MTERRRTGIKLAVASAAIVLSGFAIGLGAAPGDDLPEHVVAVGQLDRHTIPVSGGTGTSGPSGADDPAASTESAYHEGACGTTGSRDVSSPPPAV